MKIFDVTIFGIHIAPSYYGLMYALGFMIGYSLLKKRKVLSENELDSLIIYIFVGVILGGRLGYVLFYDLPYFIQNPAQIIATWNGGMSFHGGAIGVVVATLLFTISNYKISFFEQKRLFIGKFLKLTDNIVAVIPIGLGLGRIGNYLNKELLGREYHGILAVEKNGRSYFPAPLLEAFFEGLVLYLILSAISDSKNKHGAVSGAFLLFYGLFRFTIEFLRVPDVQIGYISGWLTMGQVLSIPMIIFGGYLYFINKSHENEKNINI